MHISRTLARVTGHSEESPSKARVSTKEPPSHALLRLQRLAGNGAVARLVDGSVVQREGPEEEELSAMALHDPMAQREGMPEEEEELQMKRDGGLSPGMVGMEGGALPDEAAAQIEASRGSGSRVTDSVRAAVEPVLGASMENVRVHQDSQSDSLARAMTAKAFTTGTDVYLRSDASAGDHRLMGHELAHVVQQSNGTGLAGSRFTVGAANDPAEDDADRVADAVVQGHHDEQDLHA